MESSANSKRVVVVVWRNRDLVGEWLRPRPSTKAECNDCIAQKEPIC